MTKIKVIQVQDECIGCGACESTSPKLFEMKETKAHLKGSKKVKWKGKDAFEVETDLVKDAKEAVDVCPVTCIHTE